MESNRFINCCLGIFITMLFLAIAIPNFVKARANSAVNTCTDVDLPAIAEAKKRWAEEKRESADAETIPQMSDILPYLKHPHRKKGEAPECPSGATYIIGPIGSNPSCSYHQGWTPAKVR